MKWQGTESTVASLALAGMFACGVQESAAYPAHQKPPGSSRTYSCTVRIVFDGDTLACRERRELIRLLLIDAPEMGQQRFGKASLDHLTSLIPPDHRVTIELDRRHRDDYNRILAYVWLPDGRMVNEEMVRSGYALEFYISPNDRYRGRILKAERTAKADHSGLWQTDGFRCAPVAFRHDRCR